MASIHIIEDDSDLLEVLQMYFESEGFTVIADYNGNLFTSGEAAGADLYLVDINLQGKNGFDLIPVIKKMPAPKPVLMMSANTEMKRKFISSGADGFIEKPFELQHMASNIKDMISTWAPKK